MVWHPKERPGPRLILVVGVAVAALVNIERFDLQVRYGVPVPVFDASDASAWLGFARPTTGALTSMPTRERSPETGMYFFDGAPPNATTETDEGWTMGFQFPGPSLGKSFSQCLTYHERYRAYERPLPRRLWRPGNRSRTALNIRCVSSHLLSPMRPDSLIHLRSLITEMEDGLGVDTFLVVDMKMEDMPIEAWLERIPEELRYRVVPFVWTNIQQAYPQGTLGWIWLDNHATAPWFLRQPVGQRYDFLWQMERDLRMVGGSWVQWYNRLNETALSAAVDKPDLVTFGALTLGASDGRRGKCLSFIEEKNVRSTSVTIWGISRKMGDLIHSTLLAGNNCYVELFVPSLATQANVSLFFTQLPAWESPSTTFTTYFCCGNASYAYYQRWLDEPDLCRPGPLLLHKYKEEKSVSNL